jgi:hypothetical protein
MAIVYENKKEALDRLVEVLTIEYHRKYIEETIENEEIETILQILDPHTNYIINKDDT